MIAAVVLAAGTSSRLGRPKQLLELDGKPLLQHVIDLAAASFDEVVVVLGHEADAIEAALALPSNSRVARNPDYRQGMSTSLRVGIGDLDDGVQAAAIFLGDQPRMPAELVAAVLSTWRSAGSPVARPRFAGTPGHPVIVRRDLWKKWMELTGDAGARDLLREDEVAYVEWSGSPLEDVDDWDAYMRIRSAGPPS
ncbi:MAG: nucleotidyltransferase family protein [Actinomycetota bacterium]|nr:nucleotidyltransferase family protein [Actinomycetota bacterium]